MKSMEDKRRIVFKLIVSTVTSLDIMLLIVQRSLEERITAWSLVTNVASKGIMQILVRRGTQNAKDS
jgi:hypothetical protein